MELLSCVMGAFLLKSLVTSNLFTTQSEVIVADDSSHGNFVVLSIDLVREEVILILASQFMMFFNETALEVCATQWF